MKASLTRNLVIALTLGVFCFLGITPSRAQSAGSSGGCCGAQPTTNPASTANSTQGISMTCGAGQTEVTTSAGLQCVSSSAVSTTNSTSH